MQIIILYPCSSFSVLTTFSIIEQVLNSALCHIFKANICSEGHPLPSADKWPLKSMTKKSTEYIHGTLQKWGWRAHLCWNMWLHDSCHWYFQPFKKFCSWFLSYNGDESQEYDSLNPEIQYEARMPTCVVFSICWQSKQQCWGDSVSGSRCISTCKSTVGWGAEARGNWNTEQKWCPLKYWVQEKTLWKLYSKCHSWKGLLLLHFLLSLRRGLENQQSNRFFPFMVFYWANSTSEVKGF